MKIFLIVIFCLISSTSNAQEINDKTVTRTCLGIKLTSPFGGKICDSYSQFKLIQEFYNYTEKFKEDVANNKKPENIDILLGGEKPNLKVLIEKLSLSNDYNFSLPKTFEIASFEAYPNLDYTQKIIFNEQLIEIVKLNEEHLSHLKDYKEGMIRYKDLIVGTIDATKEFAYLLKTAYGLTGAGYTSFSSVFGYEAYDLEVKIKPQIMKVKNQISTEIENIEKALETETNDYDIRISNISLIINIYSKDLKKQLLKNKEYKSELNSVEKYLDLKQDLVEQNYQLLNNKKDINKQSHAELIAEKADINSILNKINNKKDELKIAKQELSSLVYTGCGNGKNYIECTGHPVEKSNFDQIKNNLQSLVNSLDREVQSLQDKNNKTLREYSDKLRNYNYTLSNLKQEKVRLDIHKEEIREKVELLLKEFIKNFEENGKIERTLQINEQLIHNINASIF
jgi:hypothetical protein